MDATVPLNQWKIGASFDSATECEAGRMFMHQKLNDLAYQAQQKQLMEKRASNSIPNTENSPR
jgi:hypothetical protein